MGNACCSTYAEQNDIQNTHCEPMIENMVVLDKEFKTLSTMKKSLTKMGPELFVRMKKGDIYSQYSIGKLLGQGAFGTVTQVTYKKTGMIRAMKTIKMGSLFEEDHEKLLAEMYVLKDLDHPNIVKVNELYQDDKNYYLITEYLDGGELLDRILQFKSFNEGDAAKIMRQVMSAVAYCHSKNIVHRDLKPENIIFNSMDGVNIKVIDFGTSRKVSKDQKMSKRLGTPYYIAPEVLERNYDLKCDIWSCGVILYIMLAGYPPFNGRQEQDIYKKIKLGKVTFYLKAEEWKNISSDVKDLIKKMLNLDVHMRLSAEEVLNHTWIQKNQDQSTINLDIIQNLQAFTARSKFKQALLTFMASQMMTQQDQEELLVAFRLCDKNGDGTLSQEELVEAFTKSMEESGKNLEQIDAKILKIIEMVDINQTGVIDFTQFVVASIKEEQILSNQRVQQAFEIIDIVRYIIYIKDGDGYISKGELQQMMEGMDDDVWVQFLSECDKDNDGQISREEFTEILLAQV